MPWQRIHDPATALSNAMNAVADKRCNRDTMAGFYADCLRARANGEIDWPALNRAIIERWSASALKYIKERAWKECKQNPKG